MQNKNFKKNTIQNINLAELSSISGILFQIPLRKFLCQSQIAVRLLAVKNISAYINHFVKVGRVFAQKTSSQTVPYHLLLPVTFCMHMGDECQCHCWGHLIHELRAAAVDAQCMNYLTASVLSIRLGQRHPSHSPPRIPYPRERQVRSCHPSVSLQFDAERHKQVDAAADCSYHFASID